MHEVSLLMQALEIAEDAARRENAGRITRIHLRVGQLAGVVPELMASAFGVVSVGTLAEGAAFEWEEVPTRCRCTMGCPDFSPEGPIFDCPECGQISTQVLQGRELDLDQIEIEVPGT